MGLKSMKASIPAWARAILGAAIIAGVALLVFSGVLRPDAVLFTTDNNIGYTATTKVGMPAGFIGQVWSATPLLGLLGSMPVCLANVFQWVMPLVSYINWFHALMLGLASLGMLFFLMRRHCSLPAIATGFLAAFWLGTNLTLTYSGHNGKYGVLAFAGLSLWFIERAAHSRRLAWAVLAGGAVGMMFVEQQDVALFIGLFLGAYAVYAILRENEWRWKSLVAPLAVMGVMALVVGGPNVLSGYMTQVKGVVAMSDENPQQKWEYCTQWSTPPDDLVEFIAPGFRGIRSGDPEGPYWGRQGRSANWETTHQGFPNFKLEGLYVGMIPIALALFSLLLAWAGQGTPKQEARIQKSEARNKKADLRGRKPEASPREEFGERKRTDDACDPEEMRVLAQRRGDALFWGSVTVVALLLAFGKFFPLYWLFYHIPGMSSIRNPNKFLHVFQLGLGVLTAFGMDALLRGIPEQAARWSRRFAIGFLVLAGTMLIWAGYLAATRDALVNEFTATGWARVAPVMVDRMVGGALHGALVTLAIGGAMLVLVLWRLRPAVWRITTGSLVAIILVLDVLSLGRDYIKVVSLQDLVGENAVTSYLKQHLNQQRLYLLSQEGFYNNWLTVLFPYHGIETFNVAQMPRMPEDYDRWLKSVGRDPLRLWELSAVGYMLAPDQVWRQIQKEPRFASQFDAVQGFNLYASGDAARVEMVSAETQAQHRILRFKSGLSRAGLYHDWSVVADESMAAQLLDRSFNPHMKVLLAPGSKIATPSGVVATGQDSVSLQCSPADARLEVRSASAGVLLFVNKYSDDWNVEVDGRCAPLLRCNAVCMGVYVEAGHHEVRFYLSRQWGLFGTQMAGVLACCGAMGWIAFSRRRRYEEA